MRTIPRTKGALSGFIIIVLGVWGGLIPFVGPYFNYAMHTDQTWHWFADRGWLEVLPGAVAVVGGFLLMTGKTRSTTMLGALLGIGAGLWFTVGPTVSMLWHHGAITVGPPIARHTVTRMLEWLGFFYGVGGLITLFSAYALGFLAALPIVDERVVGRTVATGTAGAAGGYAAGRATAPREREPVAAPARTGDGVDTTDGVDRTDETVADRPATAPRRRTGRFFRRRKATTRT
ncbi:MAG TPA: hypothetical protein VF032_12890 [Thermoleophilaceae bacterium]